MRHFNRPVLLQVVLWAAPEFTLSAQTAKADYPVVVNLRTLNDNGHQEIYNTYYPTSDRDKEAKLKECRTLAPKIVGQPDSYYKIIISSFCTVD